MTDQNPIKIDVKELNVFANETPILKKVSVSFFEKKINTIIGPSGCGKSTLLRSINRMHDLYPNMRTEGTISLLPDCINLIEKKIDPVWVRLQVGMVFQKPNPFPKSIFENVVYGLRVRGIRKSEQLNAACETALKNVGLWSEVKDRLHQSALSLSGGQQQRLCMARAIATNPQVLLLDEPTSALDPISSDLVEKTLQELKNQITIILVTHNLESAKRISDYVTIMYFGQLIETGTSEKIFNDPSHPKTKEYLSYI